jgi:site-specific DNA recombinase
MNSVRCAIYTRKSSEEGLEQSFNSLDAQREACEAYIRSQRHEGWRVIPTQFDDGGFSGGNMDRPAVKRLMADIEARKVNVVVVYKVDRLTRSLSDFARIIEQFDKHQVSFVSVTQQFNTTSSMGRLTLNVLLSFAQFEREITGERIRDKIAASKKKGMWVGGCVPLGYDLRDHKLYVNAEEAEIVREIFRRYLQLRSVTALKDHLDRKSIRTKIRAGNRRNTGGKNFSRGCLYQILRNHIYAGEIAHKGAVYPGEHQAIISREQWNQVQKMLLDHRQGKDRKPRRTESSLLTGILFDKDGHRFTPTHANKAGRRYRYYTSQAVIRKAGPREPGSRIPAHDLEQAVMGRLVEFLRSSDELLRELRKRCDDIDQFKGILRRAGRLADTWPSLARSEREQFLRANLSRVMVESGSVAIELRALRLMEYLSAGKESPAPAIQLSQHLGAQIIILTCPFRFVRHGKALRLIIGNDQAPPVASSAAILKAVARARLWYDQIVTGEAASIRDLARTHNLTPRYVRQILPFASLGPTAIQAIIEGQCRPSITLNALADRIPLEWAQQPSHLVGPA